MISVIVSKSIHFKRNLNFLTKHSQVYQLLNSVFHISVHRTRPIYEHHHTMILTFWQVCDLTKNIITILVRVNLIHIKSASFRGICSTMNVSRFFHFKFFDHVTNHFTIIHFELFQHFVSGIHCTFAVIVIISQFFMNNFIVNNDCFCIDFRKSQILRNSYFITHIR